MNSIMFYYKEPFTTINRRQAVSKHSLFTNSRYNEISCHTVTSSVQKHRSTWNSLHGRWSTALCRKECKSLLVSLFIRDDKLGRDAYFNSARGNVIYFYFMRTYNTWKHTLVHINIYINTVCLHVYILYVCMYCFYNCVKAFKMCFVLKMLFSKGNADSSS